MTILSHRSHTYIDDECEWLPRMMLDKFLFVGGVKLRVFDVLEQEVICIRLLLLIQVQLRRGVAIASVQNSVQVELSHGLLRLAGCWGAA